MRLCSGRQTQQWLLQLSRYSARCQPDMAPSTAVPAPAEKCKAEQSTSYCLLGVSLQQVPNIALPHMMPSINSFSICAAFLDKLVHEVLPASSYAASVDTHSFVHSFRRLQGSLWPSYNLSALCLTNKFISKF